MSGVPGMLEQALAANVFTGLVVFARVGAAASVLPGFSAGWMPMQARLLLALAMTAVLTPVLAAVAPPLPASLPALGLLLLGESTIGLALGTVVRIAFSALQTAGTFIAYLTSFTTGFVQDPVAEQQSATVSGFFTTTGVVAIFAAGIDRLMLHTIADSYALFAPGAAPPLADIAQLIARQVADGFALGVQLSGPFVIVSLVYNVGAGLLSRLMPQTPDLLFRPADTAWLTDLGDDCDDFGHHDRVPQPLLGGAQPPGRGLSGREHGRPATVGLRLD
jgi:flagellar biosynthetic protein FliR